jgi:acetolactate synthase-1/2/3 large subunit
VIGCKLGEIATKRYTLPGRDKPLIHLDILAEEFDRTTPATVRLWGDARAGIEDLATTLAAFGSEMRDRRATYADDVAARMAEWRRSVRDRVTSSEIPINMARLMDEISAALPADGLLIADGGFAAHWGGLLFDTKRPGRSFVPDRGFASIGYGVPGSIGAQLGAGGSPVIAVTGDGGFNMMIGELETARRIGVAPTLVIVNNAASGYVKALQHLMYGKGNYQSSDLVEVDYARVAEAMGCHGIRVEQPEDIAAALRAGMAEKGRPSVIDVVVTRDPAFMLPAVDNRTVQVKKGDRIA